MKSVPSDSHLSLEHEPLGTFYYPNYKVNIEETSLRVERFDASLVKREDQVEESKLSGYFLKG